MSTRVLWCGEHGESGETGRLIPLMVDGLIYASSMVMLDSPRRRMPVPALARWLVGLSIAATLAANVAHGLGHGLIGRRPPRHSRDSFRLSASPEHRATVARSSSAA